MKKTIQDRLAEALTARGEREIVPSKSGKYRQFTRKAGGFYWLGKSGALRHGQNSSSSFSMPASHILDADKHATEQAAKLAKADAEWLAGHPELAHQIRWEDQPAEHRSGMEEYKPSMRMNAGYCTCDRCRTIRAVRRTAAASIETTNKAQDERGQLITDGLCNS